MGITDLKRLNSRILKPNFMGTKPEQPVGRGEEALKEPLLHRTEGATL